MSKNSYDETNDWRPSCNLGVLKKRAWMLSEIRRFFLERDIMEVETPCLCQTAGTELHLSFLSTEVFGFGGGQSRTMYLQSSPEFAMKRLLAAGSGSIFQLCKAYRNQEIGRFHNPEFSILEWYRVGFNLSQLMDDVEELMNQLFSESIILSATCERLSYQQVFLEFTGVDILESTLPDFEKVAMSHGLKQAADLCGANESVWLDLLFSHLIQPNLGKSGLTFIYNFPACQPGLARINPNQPAIAERMEVFLNGVELGSGYHELIDAKEQKHRFENDIQERSKRGFLIPEIDWRLLDSMEHGIPDCSGVAVGLDRLLMLLTGAEHIADVLSFPIDRA